MLKLKEILSDVEHGFLTFLTTVEHGVEIAVKYVMQHPAVINAVESEVKAAITDIAANNISGAIAEGAAVANEVKTEVKTESQLAAETPTAPAEPAK